jgi:hypothetical protein
MRRFGQIPVGPKILGEALGGQIDDAVGGRENRLVERKLRSSAMISAAGLN